MISSRLVAAALRAAGVPAVWIDPRDLLVTDAAHGAALPDEGETAGCVAAKLIPELDAGRVVVTGGFVGATKDGVTTTLGRGGSDYSAALLGAALKDAGRDVGAIEIWTDVDGILTADPRVVPAARSPEERAEASFRAFWREGSPPGHDPAARRGIPVAVRTRSARRAPARSGPRRGAACAFAMQGAFGSRREPACFAHGRGACSRSSEAMPCRRRDRDERSPDLDHGRRDRCSTASKRPPPSPRSRSSRPAVAGRLRRLTTYGTPGGVPALGVNVALSRRPDTNMTFVVAARRARGAPAPSGVFNERCSSDTKDGPKIEAVLLHQHGVVEGSNKKRI